MPLKQVTKSYAFEFLEKRKHEARQNVHFADMAYMQRVFLQKKKLPENLAR